QVVNRAITFIHQRIFHRISVEKIAEFAGVHPGYLSKIFKVSVGMVIPEYINRKKIEDSKYYLLHSNSSLSDIANMLGYCNQSYYTSLFKKFTGKTPGQYKSAYITKGNDVIEK
ncbi:MAG: AraC family transcriptional regulator, partial [Bacillus sp. (in: Bacteria)]|nr:AraC family transcriptional regulator [Bacillus sp. (in: firmicutes)]